MKSLNKNYNQMPKFGSSLDKQSNEQKLKARTREYAFEISSRYWLLDVPEPTRIYEQELLQLVHHASKIKK